MDEVYTVETLSKMLGVTPRCLESWREKDIGPDYIRCGHAVLYPREYLTKWLYSQPVRPR